MLPNAVIIPGTASQKLSEEICSGDWNKYPIPLIETEISHFNDGETSVKICDNIRGRDVYIIQSTCNPVNDNLIELLLLIDAAKRSTAGRITAVIPYFGYARQDRKDQPRVAISARMVANIIERAGADRVITMDLHTGQLQGFFDIPVDHIYARPVFIRYIKDNFDEKYLANSVALAPDVGAAKRTRTYSLFLGMELAMIDKRRPKAGVSEIMNIIGDIEGKNVWIFDDLIDTAGTVCNAAKEVIKKGALEVNVVVTHPVLSGNARGKILSSINRLFMTDTIHHSWYPHSEDEKSGKIVLVSVADLFRSVILKAHSNDSISELFY